MKQIIAILTGVFLSTCVFAQTRVVHGKLTVFNTYAAQHVEVTAKKAKTAVKSDSLGHFSIVCFEKDVIRIKSKIFKQVGKKVDKDTDSLLINLIFIDTKANRKLAVGYGYMNKENLTYAVNHLEQQNNDFCNYTNIFDLIKGRFPGVVVSGGEVHIRGSNSFSGKTEALYIVDGVSSSSIDWIQPCDIQSIDVLKDSSAAIYGTRGGNGVVIIKLKNGR